MTMKMNRLVNCVFRLKTYKKSQNILSVFSLTNNQCYRNLISGRSNHNQLNYYEKSHDWIVAQKRMFSLETPATISSIDYDHFCSETLESLGDYFEELVESTNELESADVLNKDGVLTVSLGAHGTYVINKQTPNKQIWLSSPVSGPKRFDFVYASDGSKTGFWFYKHTGETLHELLDDEISKVMRSKTDFQNLAFGSRC